MGITYRKSDDQRESEKILIDQLRGSHLALSNKKRTIKFSDYTDIRLDADCLFIHIASKGDSNPANKIMQDDGAAFEGWAICLKGWFPDQIKRVCLSWEIPSKISGHYNRFLYRVWKFSQMFEWFEYNRNHINELKSFAGSFTGMINNCGTETPARKEALCEEQVEYDLCKHNQEEFTQKFSLTQLNHHLPVGIKDSNGLSFFTGGNSAIDLWGIDIDGHLRVFELKYIDGIKTKKNIKIGIISELLLYVNIMRDIVLGKIGAPNAKLIEEKDLYSRITDLKGVKGIFLTNELHPLIEHGKALEIINTNLFNIPFEAVNYNWSPTTLKIKFD
ncbi:MAG: hypothetical protein LLF93_09965 [Bacteroidales bacterium]|nr:hypothetical protein [Bacteroidales bacterium]